MMTVAGQSAERSTALAGRRGRRVGVGVLGDVLGRVGRGRVDGGVGGLGGRHAGLRGAGGDGHLGAGRRIGRVGGVVVVATGGEHEDAGERQGQPAAGSSGVHGVSLLGVHADGGEEVSRGQPRCRVGSCHLPTTSLASQPKNMKTAMPSSDDHDERAVRRRAPGVGPVLLDEDADALAARGGRTARRRRRRSRTARPRCGSPVKMAGMAPGSCSLRSRGPARDALEREQVVLAGVRPTAGRTACWTRSGRSR